jgi:hypothetical protein
MYFLYFVTVVISSSIVEKPAEIQSSIQLASHLVRVPKSLSGGREFESLVWTRAL